MNREQMHAQLMELSPMEVLTREMYLQNLLPLRSMKDLIRMRNHPELMPEKIRQQIQDNQDFFLQLSDQDSLEIEHISQETYQLDERKNLELIPHWRYTTSYMHDHDFFELAFVYSGACSHQLMVEGHLVEIRLEECDLIIIPPGLKHEIGIYDNSVMVNILINRQTFQKVFFSKLPGNNLLHTFFTRVLFSNKQQGFVILRTERDRKLKDILLDMYIERMERDLFANEICDYLLNIFFLQILRHPQAGMLTENLGKSSMSLVASILLYLDQHYAAISVNELAEIYHFTPTYLNRVFKKHTGSTLLQYIKNLRITEAKKLLENTSLSVEKITDVIGYQDVPYFIEQFRKDTGMTPLQYRKQKQ